MHRRLCVLIVVLSALAFARAADAQFQFETVKTFVDGTDGYRPSGPLVQANDGWVYGLTQGFGLPATGSASQCASAFRFNPVDGTFHTIWISAGQAGPGCFVGHGGLSLAGDGRIYFVTSDGGNCNAGRIFRLTPPADVVPVFDFGCAGTGLERPAFGLATGRDGAVYGVAVSGGANQVGGIYRVGTDGTFSQVASFPATFNDPINGPQGREMTPPIQGTDGRFYGTQTDWINANQTQPRRTFVYRIDPLTGTTTVLKEFVIPANATPPDGAGIRGRLLEVPASPGTDVTLVGAAQLGGTFGAGTVFRIDVTENTPVFSKLHEFNVLSSPYTGQSPAAGLVRGSDGALYGTTPGYGFGGPGVPPSGEAGTIYSIGTDCIVTKVFSSNTFSSYAPLLLASDANFYGSALAGGNNLGSLFRLIPPPSNHAPVTADDAILTPEDATKSGTLTASDADGDQLTYSIVVNGTKGSAVITNAATGEFTYTPSANVNGTDTFSFKVNDGTIDSNIATVTVTIIPVNDSPLATDASVSTPEDTPVSGAVSASDVDGDGLTYVIVANGAKGTAAITNASTGAFTYTPNANANGPDSFTFKVNDGTIDSNIATEIVDIAPVNDAPVAANEIASVKSGESVTGTLIATDVDNPSLTYVIATNGAKGVATITNAGTGAYTYAANAGSSGTDTFTFKANDGSLDSNLATVTVTIHPGCATDITGSVAVTISGAPKLNKKTGRYTQTVTLKNSDGVVAGPVSLVLDSLGSNATLFNATGTTACAAPPGRPYIDVAVGIDAVFSPRERTTVTLQFTNPSGQTVTYTPRVLAGTGSR